MPRQGFARLLVLVGAVLTGGCLTHIPIVPVDFSRIPDQPYFFERIDDPEALRSVSRIALLQVPEPSRFRVGGSVHDFQSFADVFPADPERPEAAPGETAAPRPGFSAAAAHRLSEHLRAHGYAVDLMPVRRRKPYRLIDVYESLEPVDADAYLDVVPIAVGFARDDWTWAGPFAREVGPQLSFAVRLVSRQSRRILLATTAQYGRVDNPLVDGIRVDSPAAHVFADVDAWQADRQRGSEWLMAGLDSIMAAVAERIAAQRDAPIPPGPTPAQPPWSGSP